MFTYVVERALGIPVDFIPVAYMISEIFLVILVNRIKMYDVSSVISEYYSNAKEYGFVLFDKNMKYMGSNDVAETWMPELLTLQVDRKIDNKHSFFETIKAQVDGNCYEDFTITWKDKIIKNSVKTLYNKKKTIQIGYYVEMEDDTRNQKYIRLVEQYNEQLEKEVKKKARTLVKMQDDIIVSMADTVENRDPNTGGHIMRTRECVRIFAESLINHPDYAQYGESFFDCVIKAAPLHDFGKIAIDDSILKKNGAFTDEEYDIMKSHPEKGAHIVARILRNSNDEQFRKVAKNVARYHHEKWDGSGYPAGLSGENIPLEARIMALADVFDALVSKRCYKEKMSYDTVFSIIEESLGKQFDEKLGKLFLKQRDKLIQYYNSVEE